MKENDRDQFEPVFPYPYEGFGQELAADIRELHYAVKKHEENEKEWQDSLKSIKDVSPFKLDYKNPYMNVIYYQENAQKLNDKIKFLTEKTIGRMDRILKEQETDLKLTEQIMQAIDEKIYPEKYEGKILNNQNPEISVELSVDSKEDPQNPYSGKNHEEATLIRDKNRDKLPVDTDYFLFLREQDLDFDKTTEDILKENDTSSGNLHLNYKKIDKKFERTFDDFSKNKTEVEMDKE